MKCHFVRGYASKEELEQLAIEHEVESSHVEGLTDPLGQGAGNWVFVLVDIVVLPND